MLRVFSVRLREAREGRNQSEAARLLGISSMRLSNYESGKRESDLALLKRIVECYGVSSDWLLGLTDEKTPGVSITASGGSAVAANRSTATVHAPSAPSAEVSRLLGIIESQQAVIATLANGKQ